MHSGEVEPWEAADYLATSERVLRDTYAHLHPEHQKSAADALSKRGERKGLSDDPSASAQLGCGSCDCQSPMTYSARRAITCARRASCARRIVYLQLNW